ncbi:DMT family transporter [Methylobacterium sp. BTF04]|uniref:DMT family transporter n=1 Tax=Methylobacterium sp. BTF04 TaxID=2708300 RepID=UPI0013D3D606|nr:DMT family transporter [Methylobacterium sp. BTF04]NEU12372.1 DMT family transporter [Methylobacterium sp. BTF04]
MNPILLYPFILVAGALQAAGNSMNARLRVGLVNPWLAATVSFVLIVFVFTTVFFMMPVPLPTLETLGRMPWWAPLGGAAGAVAVFGGLAFVDKVGAGPFNGLLITANILTSLAIDHFGWFGMAPHAAGWARILGGTLMVGGIVLIAKSTAQSEDGEAKNGAKAGHGLNPALLYPFILVAGVLQSVGVSMNAVLRGSVVNPWLAAMVSFLPVVFVFATMLAVRPTPLPKSEDVAAMPWWAPLGGIAGAVAVFGGLLFVDTVGSGPFNGLLITANLLTSLAIDHFGWFGMSVHKAGKERMGGAGLMVAGIVLIAAL